jgi:prefoldin alpha subunit
LAGGEEEIRRLLAAYQQYQAQSEAIAQQLGLTQMTIQGLDRAILAIDALDSATDGQEMLVPIGSGSFVFAKLASKERVVLNVGAGVSIEKPAAEARESLKVRKAEVAEASKKLSEMLNKIDGEMAKIQSVISDYETGTGQVV